MMKVVVLIVAVVFAMQSFAIEIPARLKKIASEKNLAIGTFVLEKEMSDIGVSVKSIGTFKFERGVGITWKNISPSEFTFFASDKFYEITTKQGSKKQSLENFDIDKPISQLFKGDFSDLEDKFEIEILKNTETQTEIKLTPKISKIKNGLSSATLFFGKTSLEKCHLKLANDTIIKIEFIETL